MRLLPFLLLMALPFVMQGQFTFTTNSGAITITGYTGSNGVVVIPSTTNGYPVTSIGPRAFYDYYDEVTSVTIPNSVTNIGDEAFENCYRLTNAIIYSRVIGELAFANSGLISFTMGSNVISIGVYAFADCISLTNVTIGNSVTIIGNYAFEFCTSLTSVTIPNSVTNIGICVFFDCTNLIAMTVDTDNPAYSSVAGVLFNQNQTTLIQFPGAKAGNYTIPNGIANIGYKAFQNCPSLTNVIIPNSVTNIGSYAFEFCNSLTSVDFMGNAPGSGSDTSVFTSDNNTTVYYLPGKTGWHSPFDGRPAFLWNPQALTSGTAFGVQTNGFGFNITGSSNLVIVVEGCTNLAVPVWSPLSTNTLNTFIGTNGTSFFSDPQWTNYPGRYYRLRSP